MGIGVLIDLGFVEIVVVDSDTLTYLFQSLRLAAMTHRVVMCAEHTAALRTASVYC